MLPAARTWPREPVRPMTRMTIARRGDESCEGGAGRQAVGSRGRVLKPHPPAVCRRWLGGSRRRVERAARAGMQDGGGSRPCGAGAHHGCHSRGLWLASQEGAAGRGGRGWDTARRKP